MRALFAVLAWLIAAPAFAQAAGVGYGPGQVPGCPLSARCPYTSPENFGAVGDGATYFDGAVTASSSIASSKGTSTTAVASPSVTTVNANDVVISVFVTGATWSSAPAVANSRASEAQTAGTYGLLIGDHTVASPGVVASLSGTMSGANTYTAATIPLVPSGGSISFIASNVYQATASSTITLTKPTGTTAGDYLVACVGYYTGLNSVNTVSSPAGWSQIIGATQAKNPSMVCYGKIAGASEPSSYVWTSHYRGAVGAVGGILDYRNTSGPEGLSNTLTSTSANFSGASGYPICVANVTGPYYFGQACGTITAVNSATSVNVSFAFSATATGLQFAFGHDDTAAFQNMLASSPCATTGCNISLGPHHYILTASLSIPPNESVNITGASATIPNAANAYINSNPLVNNPGGSQLHFLTTSLTAAALTLGNTLHVTSVTSLPVLSRLAIVGGAGVGLDGGGSDGVDVLNWQSATFDSVAIVNFAGYGLYLNALAGTVQDYVENITARGMYIGFNASGGVLVGGNGIAAYIENVLVDNSVVEANGGPGISLAGIAIQAFRLTSSTIQWNQRITVGPEFSATGNAPGSKIAATYFECDSTLGSNCNGMLSTSTSMVGISIDNNFFQNPSQFTWPTYSAAGTALPTCTTTAGSVIFRQRATVTDTNSCAIGSAYTSGNSTRCDMICTGGTWTATGTASY